MTSNSHTFVFILVLRGYHVFTKVWKPALNEKLDCYHKFENNCDLFSQNVQIRWRYSTSFVAITFPCTSTNWMLLDHYRVNFIVSKTLLWAKDRNCPRELINCNKTVKLLLSKKKKAYSPNVQAVENVRNYVKTTQQAQKQRKWKE